MPPLDKSPSPLGGRAATAAASAAVAVAAAQSVAAVHSATAAAQLQQRGCCGGGGSATAQRRRQLGGSVAAAWRQREAQRRCTAQRGQGVGSSADASAVATMNSYFCDMNSHYFVKSSQQYEFIFFVPNMNS
jgi:hypothetical protein